MHCVKKLPGIVKKKAQFYLFININFITFKVGPIGYNADVTAFFPIFETLFIGTFRYGLELIPRVLFYNFNQFKTGNIERQF